MVDRSARDALVRHNLEYNFHRIKRPMQFYLYGTLGWIRTYNHLILNQTALPISVRGHGVSRGFRSLTTAFTEQYAEDTTT